MALGGPTADPPAQLVQLGQPELLGVLDEHERGLRHVDADFDDRGRHQGFDSAGAELPKDPLFFFAALQRQLGYPTIPRPAPIIPGAETPAMMARRIERLEFRVKLLEEEARGGIDLSRFDPKNVPQPQDE